MNKRLLVLAMFTFSIIIAWVVFDILHKRIKVEIPAKTQELIEPISPAFDTSILNN